MKKTDPETLIKAGLHLGHKAKKINPRAKQFIHKIEKGACIIDLFQTAEQLDRAKQFVFDLGEGGKSLLIVATKKQAKNLASQIALENNIFYITEKWTGGFITNFDEIFKNIKKLKELIDQKADGSLAKLPKHELVGVDKKITRTKKIYGGVLNMERLPDAVFIIDIKKEANAAAESRNRQIPTIAVVDTNCDPTLVDHPIVANDDSISSIDYLLHEIVGAYNEGKKKIKTKE